MNLRLPPGNGLLPVLLLIVMLLYGCQGNPAHVSSEPGERVLPEDHVQVARELTVPAGRASIVLQNGNVVSGAVDRFVASCRFVMKAIKSVPQTIEPGTFRVTAVRYWEDFVIPDYRDIFYTDEFINYEITLQLNSAQQPAVHSLLCRHDDESADGRHLTVSEMQQALGDYARIVKSAIK